MLRCLRRTGSSLQRRIEYATDAIHRRMKELLNDQDAGSVSERLALRNALETLADLQKIAFTRKPSGRVSRGSGQAISGLALAEKRFAVAALRSSTTQQIYKTSTPIWRGFGSAVIPAKNLC